MSGFTKLDGTQVQLDTGEIVDVGVSVTQEGAYLVFQATAVCEGHRVEWTHKVLGTVDVLAVRSQCLMSLLGEPGGLPRLSDRQRAEYSIRTRLEAAKAVAALSSDVL